MSSRNENRHLRLLARQERRQREASDRQAQAALHADSNAEAPAQRTIVIAAGGTGGHLIPGVALAQEFERLSPDIRVVFLIPGKQLEKSILDAHGLPYLCIGGKSPRGGLIGKLRAAWALTGAYRRARRILSELKPLQVFGAGGYGSVCVGLAAHRMGIPLALLEQNTIPGRVNRLMSRFAKVTYAQWPLERELHRTTKVEVVGNPIRRNIGRYDRATASRLLDFDPSRKTLLVMGGSQGSSAINAFITDNLLLLEKYHRKLQVIHLTGNGEYNEVRARWAHSRVKHRVMPFAKDMGPLLCASDIVLCRAGATTISELTALGRAMALVPLPNSADNHQYHNARYVAGQGAAVVIKQENLDRPATLETLLDELVLKTERLRVTSDCASLMGRPGAGKTIALRTLESLGMPVPTRGTEVLLRRSRESERTSATSQRDAA